MLTGKIFATTDKEVAKSGYINNMKVIYLGDPVSLEPDCSNFIISSPLTPDYNILAADIDGRLNDFEMMYLDQLKRQPALEFFSAILAALFKGINIILYFPKDALGLKYIEYILIYIQKMYGITVETKSTLFNYDISYNQNNINFMYLSNTIDSIEFILYSDELGPDTLHKLIHDVNPPISNPNDSKEYIDWFSNYKLEMINAGKPLITPFVKAEGAGHNC